LIKSKKKSYWDSTITSENKWFDLHFKEILKYRDLLWLFVKRDFTTFYKQTVLGPLWFFLQPLISTFLFSIIFNKIAKIPTNETPPYLFYMSGIIAWNYFADCLNTTSSTFTNNARMFGKVYFPRIIIPISKVFSGLSKFILQLLLFFIIFLYFLFTGNDQIFISFKVLIFMPFLILQMACLGLGLGFIISSLTAKYRDLNYLIGFFTQLLMYASPIIYPLSIVPEKFKYIILANPITPIIELFRIALLGKGDFNFNMIAYSVISTITIFLIGLLVFNKVEKTFIDTV
jgi:lipopolysaccharide transport system permease protein